MTRKEFEEKLRAKIAKWEEKHKGAWAFMAVGFLAWIVSLFTGSLALAVGAVILQFITVFYQGHAAEMKNISYHFLVQSLDERVANCKNTHENTIAD